MYLAVKRPLRAHGNNIYALYHRTDWTIVPKILAERMVRPADWAKDNKGIPQQFPSYGPFGMAVETGTTAAPLSNYTAAQLSNGLYKIGKGQLNAGIIGYFQDPPSGGRQ